MPLDAPVIAITFKDFAMRLWAFAFPLHGIINDEREQGRHENDDDERNEIDARILTPSGQGVHAVAVDLLHREDGERESEPVGPLQQEESRQGVDHDDRAMKGHKLGVSVAAKETIQMEKRGP